jgi:hypothetical protein
MAALDVAEWNNMIAKLKIEKSRLAEYVAVG